ncbi:MAG: Pyrophosphatase PpaX [Elusimicrobia bacterium]|nr:Pyrophosphatase PpaX [Elusimicrobiota bacterium]
MTSLRLFLFDLDGTLVSTGGAGLRALSKAFQELYGLSNADTRINPSGKTDPAIFREIVKFFFERDASQEEIESIAQTYLAHLETEMKQAQTRVLKGVEYFIEKVASRSDIVAGLGTGNLEKGARLKLGSTRLNSFFPFGGFGSDAEDRAEVLRWGHKRAQERTQQQIKDEDVFIIGDTLLDVSAAKRARFKSVAVATGQVSLEQLETGAPDYLFRDLTQGEDLL